MGQIPGQVGATTYGLSWNCQPDCRFDYLTGVEVSDPSKLPSDLTVVKVPAARYAVFPLSKHVSTMPATFDTIFSKWVLDCGLPVADGHCFERYTPEFNPQTGMGGMEIWVALKG